MNRLECGGEAEVHCVREVRVEVPYERRDDLMHFYGELLGLPLWPPEQQIPGGFGAGHGQRGVYFQYRHDARVEPMRRRFSLLVRSLNAVAQRLEESGWPFARYRGLGLTEEWMLLEDPAGHLIELRQVQPI